MPFLQESALTNQKTSVHQGTCPFGLARAMHNYGNQVSLFG